MFVFLWEDPNGERKWEAVLKGQTHGFMEKLISDGVHPATVMVAWNPLLFHWVWKEYHRGMSDVDFYKVNEEIYGTEPINSKHKPVDVPNKTPLTTKYGWIAPDGRYFKCDYGGHSHLADKIVGEIQSVSNPEKHLEDLGWAKILSGGASRKRYAVGMAVGKKLTDAQLRTMQKEGLDDAYGVSYLL